MTKCSNYHKSRYLDKQEQNVIFMMEKSAKHYIVTLSSNYYSKQVRKVKIQSSVAVESRSLTKMIVEGNHCTVLFFAFSF